MCKLWKCLGELVLHLTKATYEQLGLEGSPTSKLKRKYGKSPLSSTVQAVCYVMWHGIASSYVVYLHCVCNCGNTVFCYFDSGDCKFDK